MLKNYKLGFSISQRFIDYCSTSNPPQIETPHESLSGNDTISPIFFNRNPRNFEQLRYEHKPLGYELEDYNVSYWNRLFFETTHKHTSAWVQHYLGNVIVSASTKEWAIAKLLFSNSDVCATINIARILANRCLKAGINFVDIKGFTQQQLQTEKFKTFINKLEEEGLALCEPTDKRKTSNTYLHQFNPFVKNTIVK